MSGQAIIAGGATSRARRCAEGFTLVELLVVMVIVALIMVLAVPALRSTQSERYMVGAASAFATNIQWAMNQARKSGNPVYLVFKWGYDAQELLGHELPPGYAGRFERTDQTWSGGVFRPPDNCGIRRVATGYSFIEERGRTWPAPAPGVINPVPEGTPYTYLDFLNELDAGLNPPEPQYPIEVDATAAAGGATSGSYVNRTSVPKFFYPLDVQTTPTTYTAAYLGDAYLSGSLDFSLPGYQSCKIFDVADTEVILSYEVDNHLVNGLRVYDLGVDHPRLNEQIKDYILLREAKLPESVYLMNPWKNLFPVSELPRAYADYQVLQHIYKIGPDGSFRVYQWTYDPEAFPDGSWAGLVHGALDLRQSLPDFYYFFFAIEEAVDPQDHFNVAANRRAQHENAGRVVWVWPLNSRVRVDPYAPNDSTQPLLTTDPGWRPFRQRHLDKPEGATYPYTPYL